MTGRPISSSTGAAEDPRRGRVRVRDVALRVERQDRVGGGVGDRAEVLLARAQRLLGLLLLEQRAELGGDGGHERDQPLVLFALLPHEELHRPRRPRRARAPARRCPPRDPASCANRPRSKPRVGLHVPHPDGPRELPRLSGHADAGHERQRLGDPPERTRARARRRATPGCTRARGRRRCAPNAWPERPAGALADRAQHVRDRQLRRLGAAIASDSSCPSDREALGASRAGAAHRRRACRAEA